MPAIAEPVTPTSKWAKTDPTILDIRVSDDLTGIEGIEVLEGQLTPLPDDREGLPRYRDVKIKSPVNHPIRERIFSVFGNILVLAPAAITTEDNGKGGKFRILNREGDRRVQWFNNNLRSINEAKALFNELIGQGMVAYRIDPNTGAAGNSIMKTFDPGAEEVVFMSPRAMVGG